MNKLAVLGTVVAVSWMSWLTYHVVHMDNRLVGLSASDMDADSLWLRQEEDGSLHMNLGPMGPTWSGGHVMQRVGPDMSYVSILDGARDDTFIDLRTAAESRDDCMVTLKRRGARIAMGFHDGVACIVATDASGKELWRVPER